MSDADGKENKAGLSEQDDGCGPIHFLLEAQRRMSNLYRDEPDIEDDDGAMPVVLKGASTQEARK